MRKDAPGAIIKLFEKILRSKKAVIGFGGIALVAMILAINTNKNNPSNTQSPKAPAIKAIEKINKAFVFYIGGNKVTYTIESAELQDEIILKGQRAAAVKGKTFLIINLKIRSDNKQAIEINSRDYIRLSVNNTNDKLAPDIHNDPVLIQAIATKPTRLGFPIKDTDKKLTLYIGEIEADKTTIAINFKY